MQYSPLVPLERIYKRRLNEDITYWGTKLEAQWAEPVSLTFHSVLRKLYTEPSIGASYQISINMAKWSNIQYPRLIP
jgi:hypothetical protein